MIAVPNEFRGIRSYFADRDIRREAWGRYKLDGWTKYFPQDADFMVFTNRFPSPLARQTFCEIEQKDAPNLRQLFFAAMIWGYGTVGTGAWRTDKMLATLESEAKIESAFELVRQGRVADAYRALNLYWCGPSYISKFLYACGLCSGAMPLPVILDSVVAGTLSALLEKHGHDHREFFKLGKDGMPQYFPEGYERYVLMLNDWARQLHVQADEIELYLFEKDGMRQILEGYEQGNKHQMD